jgi:hypothetical protein
MENKKKGTKTSLNSLSPSHALIAVVRLEINVAQGRRKLLESGQQLFSLATC